MNWLLITSILIVVPGVLMDNNKRSIDTGRYNQILQKFGRLSLQKGPDTKIIVREKSDLSNLQQTLQSMHADYNNLNHVPEIISRRGHRHRSPSEMLTEISKIPDLESMLPGSYFEKHPRLGQFRPKFGGKNKKVNKIKEAKEDEALTQYIEMGSMRSLPKRTRKRNADIVRRRGHGHDSPLDVIKEIDEVPNLESVLPASFLRKHKTHLSESRRRTLEEEEEKLDREKEAKKEEVLTQHGEMGSKKNLQNRTRKSNVDMVREMLIKLHSHDKEIKNARRQSPPKMPALTRSQFKHVGNTLFHIGSKNILGAHRFPKKEAEHSLYGNPESLVLNQYPDSTEYKAKKLKKIIQSIPLDAHKQPWRLYDRNHPGLNLLYDKKMMLDAAKFKKPKQHLVYGNMENLGTRYDYSNRFSGSDFRRYNNHDNFNRPPQREISYEESDPYEIISNWHTRPNQYSTLRPLKIFKNNKDKNKNDRKIQPNKKELYLVPYVGRKEKFSGNSLQKAARPFLAHGNLREKDKTKLKRKKYRKKTLSARSEANGNPPRLVYGNMDNLGIRYGNTPYRWKYSDFRKDNRRSSFFNNHKQERWRGKRLNSENIVYAALKAIENSNKNNIINYKPFSKMISEDINGANEVFDFDDDDLRRSAHHAERDKHNKNDTLNCKSSSVSLSESDSGDKNPGNPYTIFRGKYKQNWLWNHFLDGDHMNINPYGPKFNNLGPTGTELFFGRKWWYFNQDDYKPFRR